MVSRVSARGNPLMIEFPCQVHSLSIGARLASMCLMLSFASTHPCVLSLFHTRWSGIRVFEAEDPYCTGSMHRPGHGSMWTTLAWVVGQRRNNGTSAGKWPINFQYTVHSTWPNYFSYERNASLSVHTLSCFHDWKKYCS